MGRKFAVGDRVGWRNFYTHSECKGIITRIFEDGQWMSIGFFTVHEPEKTIISVNRVKGRWLVHRPYRGYKERLYHLPSEDVS